MPVGLDALQDAPGCVLGFLDVRLIEGVDAEQAAGDGGGELPPEDLGPEQDRLVAADANDRRSGAVESGQ